MERCVGFLQTGFLTFKKAKDYENSLDAIAAEVSYVEKDELTGTTTATCCTHFFKGGATQAQTTDGILSKAENTQMQSVEVAQALNSQLNTTIDVHA